jgi:DeoR family fructose operon transcriptional repressor
MYAEERQQAITTLVAERGRLSVADLAEAFDVTTETIRRDLSALERAGLLRRVHGGAVPAAALTMLESAVSDRDRAQADEKDRIAKAAADLVPRDGGSVVLDAGNTTSRLASRLPRDRRLTVITNSVPAVVRLAGSPSVDLYLLPGRVRRTTQAAVGEQTVAALGRLRVDVSFLGTNGITVGHGLSTPDHSEAAAKRAMVRCANRVVVLADSTKLGAEHTVRFAELEEVDVLVTDSMARPRDVSALESRGIEVVVA